jgi:hypothetical protein
VKVLKSIQKTIHQPKVLSKTELECILSFKTELKTILQTEYQADIFAIKDPRISILQNLYISAFEELGVVPVVIRLTRNSANVARSINRMNSIPPAEGEIIYRRHHELIKKLIKENQLDSFKVDFEDLLTNTVIVMENIRIFLGLREVPIDDIINFIDTKLVNFK